MKFENKKNRIKQIMNYGKKRIWKYEKNKTNIKIKIKQIIKYFFKF